MKCEQEHLTTGLAAGRIGEGLQGYHVDRLARRGKIPFARAGRLKLIRVDDLPAVRAAAVAAGYIQASPAAVATG